MLPESHFLRWINLASGFNNIKLLKRTRTKIDPPQDNVRILEGAGGGTEIGLFPPCKAGGH